MHYSLREKFADFANLPLSLDKDVQVETQTVVVKDGKSAHYPDHGGFSAACNDGKKKKPAATHFD